jgi:hypothetical protein
MNLERRESENLQGTGQKEKQRVVLNEDSLLNLVHSNAKRGIAECDTFTMCLL